MSRTGHENDQPRRCGGPSRREVLRVGSLGFLGLGLDELFRLRAQAGDGSGGRTASRSKAPAEEGRETCRGRVGRAITRGTDPVLRG